MSIKIKFIQVNIFRGKYLENLIDFLKEENPDIVSMQEVTSGKLNLYFDKSAQLFPIIKKELGLFGIFNSDIHIYDSPGAVFGNVILTRYPIINSQVITLKTFRPISLGEFLNDLKVISEIPRHLLDATLEFGDRVIHAMTVHGSWTDRPKDTPEKIREAELIASHLKSTGGPFIMGGDLNLPPQARAIKLINKVANNLMIDSGFEHTTHPTLHKIAPRKLLIDYIFSSGHFKVKSLDVPEVVISDHLPVVAELEVID